MQTAISIITAGSALTALIISIISIRISKKVHHDSRKIDILNQIYGIFNEGILTLLQSKSLNHMVELPENYIKIKNLVQASFGKPGTKQSSEMLLKERAAALFIFQIFEHFYFLLDHAKKVNAKERIYFINKIFEYLTRRLLRNPRLLYYWNESGGNLKVHFEPEVGSTEKRLFRPYV